MPSVDPSFSTLPARELSAAAFQRASDKGASFADFRLEQVRAGHLAIRDGAVETATDSTDLGLAVRVVYEGAWGFASGLSRTPAAAAALADQAIETARVSRVLGAR